MTIKETMNTTEAEAFRNFFYDRLDAMVAGEIEMNWAWFTDADDMMNEFDHIFGCFYEGEIIKLWPEIFETATRLEAAAVHMAA